MRYFFCSSINEIYFLIKFISTEPCTHPNETTTTTTTTTTSKPNTTTITTTPKPNTTTTATNGTHNLTLEEFELYNLNSYNQNIREP